MAQETIFGERMSVEQFIEKTEGRYLEIHPRIKKKDGKPVLDPKTGKPERLYGHTDGVEDKTKPLFYFETANMLGYVPSELGQKMEKGETLGKLFITEVTTDGYEKPMYMLCESKRETIWKFSLD